MKCIECKLENETPVCLACFLLIKQEIIDHCVKHEIWDSEKDIPWDKLDISKAIKWVRSRG